MWLKRSAPLLSPMPLLVCHLGRIDYAPTWALQQRIQARLIAAKKQGEAVDH